MQFNTESVQRLISNYRKKKEEDANKIRKIREKAIMINEVVNLALKALTKEDIKKYRFGKHIIEFSDHGLRWVVWKVKRGVSVHVHLDTEFDRIPVFFSDYSADTINDAFNGNYSQIDKIMEGLPAFLTKMVEVFPALESKLSQYL